MDGGDDNRSQPLHLPTTSTFPPLSSAGCLSPQSDLCLPSWGDASLCYLATVSTATKMLLVSLPTLPPPEVARALLCAHSLPKSRGRCGCIDGSRFASLIKTPGLKLLRDVNQVLMSSGVEWWLLFWCRGGVGGALLLPRGELQGGVLMNFTTLRPITRSRFPSALLTGQVSRRSGDRTPQH